MVENIALCRVPLDGVHSIIPICTPARSRNGSFLMDAPKCPKSILVASRDIFFGDNAKRRALRDRAYSRAQMRSGAQ